MCYHINSPATYACPLPPTSGEMNTAPSKPRISAIGRGMCFHIIRPSSVPRRDTLHTERRERTNNEYRTNASLRNIQPSSVPWPTHPLHADPGPHARVDLASAPQLPELGTPARSILPILCALPRLKVGCARVRPPCCSGPEFASRESTPCRLGTHLSSWFERPGCSYNLS